MEISLMRRNALTFTFSIYAVLLVLVLLSAVGKAGEKRATVSATPATPATSTSLLMLASSVEVPVSDDSQELLHEQSATAAIPQAASKPRVMMMEVTAYCPCKECCGKNARGITASGLRVSHNNGLFVAADSALPFHTRLVIPGYASDKPVPVIDRGGAIKGSRLDVFFPTHEEALKWGRRMITVTVTP